MTQTNLDRVIICSLQMVEKKDFQNERISHFGIMCP